jgi:hypothetical protein
MLLVVRHRDRFGKVGEHHPRVRHLRRHRLVSEVETQPVRRGPADHPRQENRGRQEIEIGQLALAYPASHSTQVPGLHSTPVRRA